MPDDVLGALDRCLAPSAEGVADAPAAAPAADPPSPAPAPPPPERPRPAPIPSSPEPAGESLQALLRVPAEAVEALTRSTHELASALGGEAAIADGITGLGRRAAALAGRAEHLRGRVSRLGAAERPDQSDETAATDSLGTELRGFEAGLRALAREAADLSRMRASVSATIDGAASRLTGEAERLALVPAETVFGGFPRALRDLAREAGREVDVTAQGLDLPVDRAMLQALKDPVLHALRNALSHGAEPGAVRERQGKPAALSIALEVAVRGGHLRIAVADDGKGPDLPAIEETGRRRGLLAPGADLDAEGLLALVFEPGFSTASQVDTLSGRGIGLSVVADAVRRLGGQVRLAPREPWGTVLAMSLPLSAAREALLLVEAGSETYALPSRSAERLLRLDPSEIETVMGRPVARIGAEGGATLTLPILSLRSLLGIRAGSEPDAADGLTALLLRAGYRRIVLAVEALRDVRTHRVLPAPPIGADPRLIAGTVILPGDRPALVLDPEGLIARALEAGGPAAPAPSQGGTNAGAPRSTQRATILVVDDSITTRTLEKGILEAAGYRVVVCVDGQDALDRLRAGIEPVDLVVADVEMPRLDGFGLVKALRAEADFARLPIILMTSRGDPEDVARGLELGADAYLTKQRFDQRQLLDTIGQLL